MGNTAPEAQMQKKQQETSTKTPLSFLDEGEGIGYSLLFRPVQMQKFNFSGFFEGGKTAAAAAKNSEAEAQDSASSDTAKTVKDELNKSKKTEATNFGNISQITVARLTDVNSLRNDTSTPEVGSYICMPLPIALRDAVSLQYSQADLGSLGAGLQLGQDVFRAYQDSGSVLDAVKEGVAGGGSYLLRTLLSEVSSSAGAFIQKGAGNIPNPFSVTLFEKVQLRTFNFEWIIQPKTPDESKRIKRIINLIRYYSLPSVQGLYIDVPFEWEIAFLGNDTLFAFSRCVLENMETNYSPNGFPSFMEDDYSQSISLTLSFKEIYPLTKESVVAGPASMKPEFGGGFEAYIRTPPPTPPPASSKEESAQSQRATAEASKQEIRHYVDDWRAKDRERIELIEERDQALRAREPDPNRIAKLNNDIAVAKQNMNSIKAEVDSLIETVKNNTGQTIPPLPTV